MAAAVPARSRSRPANAGGDYGVEIEPAAAALAAEQLTTVLVGNVETMELPYSEASFDVIIISEVLDIWSTRGESLRALCDC